MTEKIEKTEAEWRAILTQEQYEVTRNNATERAFSGKYWDNHDDGVYYCICCGASLFHSDAKFESGSGWPSFTTPLSDEHLETQEDRSLFMTRTEVHCSACEAHLGHVFPDGPQDAGGLRYCINSASLSFEPEE
tara:strand:+ start:147 stop:548 length:402 start_codon:yes stop_codon:yes gene_type:complete